MKVCIRSYLLKMISVLKKEKYLNTSVAPRDLEMRARACIAHMCTGNASHVRAVCIYTHTRQRVHVVNYSYALHISTLDTFAFIHILYVLLLSCESVCDQLITCGETGETSGVITRVRRSASYGIRRRRTA